MHPYSRREVTRHFFGLPVTSRPKHRAREARVTEHAESVVGKLGMKNGAKTSNEPFAGGQELSRDTVRLCGLRFFSLLSGSG